MKLPTPQQTVRLLKALDHAGTIEIKKPNSHVAARLDVEDVIEMVEKYPQIVSYAAELIVMLDKPQSHNEHVRILACTQAFATLAKEILELDDER